MARAVSAVVIGSLLSILVSGGCAATPGDGPEPAGADSPAAVTGDLAAGKAVYDANCATCHKLGTYDTEGRRNLAGRDDEVKPSFTSRHHGRDLSEADVDALRAFIATY